MKLYFEFQLTAALAAMSVALIAQNAPAQSINPAKNGKSRLAQCVDIHSKSMSQAAATEQCTFADSQCENFESVQCLEDIITPNSKTATKTMAGIVIVPGTKK
jgi:hypothetical protein